MYLKRLALFVQSQRMIYWFPIITLDYSDEIHMASGKMIFEHLINFESVSTNFQCF